MNIISSFIVRGRLYFVTEQGKMFWVDTNNSPDKLDWFFEFLTEVPA